MEKEKDVWSFKTSDLVTIPNINYTLAQVCAFQFLLLNHNNHKEAWETYYNLCKICAYNPVRIFFPCGTVYICGNMYRFVGAFRLL